MTREPVQVGTAPSNGRPPDELVVQTVDLTRRYGERTAVSSLNLNVRRGEVYGFLGPNGAGKTTTLRMLLGLIEPTSGSATVVGQEPGSPESLIRVGAMIEQPAFYPFLSGYENLRLLASYAGVSKAHIPEVLAEVDLTDRANDKFGAYSQGMKQRLGLAAALLKDPDLLILDEPSNGLDPAGMAEMRALIRSLGQGRRTVLLSSHLLGEVEQICDRVGVIRAGELVAEGSVADLRGADRLHIHSEPRELAQSVLLTHPGVREVAIDGDELVVTSDREATATINEDLVRNSVAVHALYWKRPALEDVFLDLTGNEEARS
jgi:ABC-2 type transport system ATP-binding protein